MPTATRGAAKRAAIVAAARRAFLEDGFGAVSMDRIAAEAVVSKRTVYNHFASKEALFAAVVRDLYETVAGAEGLNPDPAAPADRALTAFAEALLAQLARPERQALIRLVIAEGRRFPQLSELYFQEGKEPAVRRLAAWLEDQARRGRLAVPDAQAAALQFLGLVKEPAFWPTMLGVQPLHAPSTVVADAVTTFLARYGHPPATEA